MNRFQMLLACLALASCGGQKPATKSSAEAAPSAQAAPSDKPAFTSSVPSFMEWSSARLKELRPAWTLGPGPDELSLLVTVGDRQAALGLGRMWRYCEAGAEDCEATVRAYLDQAVSGLEQVLSPPKLEASQLIVAVRSKGTVDAYRERAPDLLTEPLSDDVYAVYMFDSPSMAKAATVRDLTEIGLDEKAARARALENTQKQLGKPEDHVKDLKEGELGFFPQGFYTSSYLYPHGAWAKVAKKFDGQLLVSVPSNDVLLYADGRHPLVLTVIMALADRTYRESERRVSPRVFKWTPGGWVAQ